MSRPVEGVFLQEGGVELGLYKEQHLYKEPVAWSVRAECWSFDVALPTSGGPWALEKETGSLVEPRRGLLCQSHPACAGPLIFY